MSEENLPSVTLNDLLNPNGIAVVGASTNRGKIGNILFRNLATTLPRGLYAVNSSADNVEGKKAYRSLSAIPYQVDLAIVAVPRDAVPGVILDAAAKHVKGAVIITSGFREVDEHGTSLEADVKRLASEAGIRIFGPNTLGLVTPSFNATFAFPGVQKGGRVALVAQSGGLGVYMLEWAQRSKTGISYFVSLGNQADISEAEVLDFLAHDTATRVIFVYLESVSDGDRFLEMVPRATRRKPVIFLKGGKGERGSEAARTHTGNLAGSSHVFRAAVNAVGGILVENLEDSLNLARLLTAEEPIKPDLLVVTNSGGHGVITADEIERSSLRLTALPQETVARLSKLLPPQVRPANPLDLSGDATVERYRIALEEVKHLDCTKLVLVQSIPLADCVDVAKTMMSLKGRSVVGVVMGTDEDDAARILDDAGIPSFRFPEAAVRAIDYYTTRPQSRIKVRKPDPISEAAKLVEGKTSLRNDDAMRLMETYGITVPRRAVVSSAEEAVRAAEDIGYPVVMKILPNEPVHKTELQGVIMNLVEERQVIDAFTSLSKITSFVFVQQQVSGVEVYLGGIDDPIFGETILLSAGGIYVEVIGRPSHRLAPVAVDEAREMLHESRVHELLNARNRGYDEDGLVLALLRLSKMTIDLRIKEVDLNPIIVNAEGAFVVDIRTIL